MGKRNNKAKRSLGSLPNGLVRKSSSGGKKNYSGSPADPGNPFEITARQKRPKHLVHNRPISKPKTTKHALESLQRRQTQLRTTMHTSKKANQIIDRRIGQYDPTMSQEDQMLARLVRERTRQSQRVSKYRLDDDDDGAGDSGRGGNELLTHKGERLDPSKSENLYSDDEDDYGGNLEAVDTELHFGGVGLSTANPYGKSGGTYGGDASGTDLSKLYGQTRKTELDDLIARRKAMKAERMEARESQVDTFEKMDEEFGEISALLHFRKNEKKPLIPPKPSKEEQEMNEWNVEMRQMMARPKRQATDRTKTPEEIAKEEAERLHKLETRRLARMNGDFEEDDFSDISVENANKFKSKKRNQAKRQRRSPDDLSDSDDDQEDGDGLQMMFTADGLKYFDKDGNVVEKNANDGSQEGKDNNNSDSDSASHDDSDSDDEKPAIQNDDGTSAKHPIPVGCRVRGNYRAAEQYDGHEAWYEGKIVKVHKKKDGSVKYDVEYDDGDLEEGMIPQYVRAIEETIEEEEKEESGEKHSDAEMQLKRKKAKEKARNEIPYVFEVPTTLESLHELIAKYASTGKDASTIIFRIHKANSVRLDRRNGEKMQNFYDVLLRRFMAVGDAMFTSGDGGEELGRYEQLNSIAKVMYTMAQDAPETAGAVWSRRIGFLQNAHGKRLRDSEFVREEEDEEEDSFWTAWPSTGVFLLLRVLGRIFPVTDRRHNVVTPAVLLLAQMTSQTPVVSRYDLAMGVMCSGLLIEYTKEAKRVVPEALSFLASSIRLFSPDPGHLTNPALEATHMQPFCLALRQSLSKYRMEDSKGTLPHLRLEKSFVMNTEDDGEFAVALLNMSLCLVEKCTLALMNSFTVPAETELLYEVSSSILSLRPKAFCLELQKRIAKTASVIADACKAKRAPLQRRGATSTIHVEIKTLAPRMEDPTRYSMSRDKGKKSVQAAIDRTRREYKREHKAITRELRLDGSFIESERRKEQANKDAKARAKRQKNFAWLEGEQASMNQQVRLGGGLLKGGGTGLARAKVATAKMGIKKGGKF